MQTLSVGHLPAATIISYPGSIVFAITKRYEAVAVRRTPHKSHHERKCTNALTVAVCSVVTAPSPLSYTELAKMFNISSKTVRGALNSLNLKNYVQRRVQLLTFMKKERKPGCPGPSVGSEECTWIGHVIFFSNKKLFCVDQAFNCRNYRWAASEKSRVPCVQGTKTPQAVHFCLVSTDCIISSCGS